MFEQNTYLLNASERQNCRFRAAWADCSTHPAQSDLDVVPQGPIVQHFLPSPTSISCRRGRQFSTSCPVQPRFRAAGADNSPLPVQSDLDFVRQGAIVQHFPPSPSSISCRRGRTDQLFAWIPALFDLAFVAQGPQGATFYRIPVLFDIAFVSQEPHASTFDRLPGLLELAFVPQVPHGSTFDPVPACSTSLSCRRDRTDQCLIEFLPCSNLAFVVRGPHRSTFDWIPALFHLAFVLQGPHWSTFNRFPGLIRPHFRAAGAAPINFRSNSYLSDLAFA